MKLKNLAVFVLAVLLSGIFTAGSRAEDPIETAGIAAGVTAGNMWFLPIKAISLSVGALSGALSFLLTGNADLTKQIWQDTIQGPYVITPDVARQAVGERPELRDKK